MESTATAPATCDIARLPDDLLSASLARTGPLGACRGLAGLPRRGRRRRRLVPPPAARPAPARRWGAPRRSVAHQEAALHATLRVARPVLLADGLTSMWLDRDTAAKCYMLSARKLCIFSGDTPRYWRWIPLTDSRFSEGAELLKISWLEIGGKIHCNMLSQNTTYAAYMVFKMSDKSYGLDYPLQVAEVSIGATESTRQVCLGYGVRTFMPVGLVHVQHPQTRADGWMEMEMEMGEFKNEGEDGEVSFSLKDTCFGYWKKGLIVRGIETRVKK